MSCPSHNGLNTVCGNCCRHVQMVMVFGEITTKAKVDYEAVVRKTCREIGFISDDVGLDADKCKVCSTWKLLICLLA